MSNTITKPPLGITPRRIMNHQRLAEINEAMKRYINHQEEALEIPIEWLEERNEICRSLKTKSNG
jgi:hypothetical protein